MKYEDVQIGNYVKWYAEDKCHLYKVNKKTFVQDGEIEYMAPIWITPELLKMLGFRVVEGIYAIYEKNYNIAGVPCVDIVSYNFQTSNLNISHVFDFKENFGHTKEFDGSVMSLHKLQQLMKLCGCKPLEVDEKGLDNYLNERR